MPAPGEKEVEKKRKDNDPADHRFGSFIRAVTLPSQVSFDLRRAQHRKSMLQLPPCAWVSICRSGLGRVSRSERCRSPAGAWRAGTRVELSPRGPPGSRHPQSVGCGWPPWITKWWTGPDQHALGQRSGPVVLRRASAAHDFPPAAGATIRCGSHGIRSGPHGRQSS
jgi:hypothetical protein